jgi:F420-dependent oxidoreductase-like protein
MDLVGVPAAEQWATMLGVAKRIEAAGYQSAWLYDHFHTVPDPTQEATHEVWTLTAALAAATDTLRLGQMCTCNSYRPPALVGKMTSTIDVISGGRLDVGIGAGWYEHEYLAYGYEFPKPSVRIGQLNETVQILKAMWTEDEANFEGKYYSVAGAINRPKPLQDPHPPLWIAGGGEQLTLKVVARHGDYSNFGGSLETFVHKSEVLDRHCADVGRDPAEIIRSMGFTALVDPDEAALERAAGQAGRSVQEVLDSPMSVIGSVDQIVAHLATFQDAGAGYFVPYFPDALWGDSIERFATEVMPQLQ